MLPAEYREQVLRLVVRDSLQAAPLAVALFVGLGFLGGSWPIALGALLLGVPVVLRTSLTNSVDSVNARLTRYGYPPGHALAVRNQRDEAAAERCRTVWRRER